MSKRTPQIDRHLPYCPKCGALIEANALFCDKCGTSLTSNMVQAPTLPPPVYPPYGIQTGTMGRAMQRPTGVTILAILAALGGLALVIFGVITSLFGFGIILLVLGLIELAVAYAFWTGASWGWWSGVIVGVIDVASIVVLNLVGLIIGVIILYYITRPNVRAWFHEA